MALFYGQGQWVWREGGGCEQLEQQSGTMKKRRISVGHKQEVRPNLSWPHKGWRPTRATLFSSHKEAKRGESGWIKSHLKSEALIWLSSSHGACATVNGQAICLPLRPWSSSCREAEKRLNHWVEWKKTLAPPTTAFNSKKKKPNKEFWNLPESSARLIQAGTRWSGAAWSRTLVPFDAEAQFWVSATRTPLLWRTALQESRPSWPIRGIHSTQKERKSEELKLFLLSFLV